LNLEFFFLDLIRDPIRDPIHDPIRDPGRDPIRDPVCDLIRDPVRSDPGFVDTVGSKPTSVDRAHNSLPPPNLMSEI